MIKRVAMVPVMVFMLCVVLVVSVFPFVYGVMLVRSKEETIRNFKALCDAHSDVASYESLGKTLLGQDIWIFKFGNPAGGRVLWDGQLHGNEDLGTEIIWMFVQWLVSSNEPEAELYLQRNYLLVIPVVNVDSSARDNMRRRYVLSDGDVLDVPYGVDLNRNFAVGWGSYGSIYPESSNYMGLYGGSEPETRVLTATFRELKPSVYVNFHSWGGPVGWISGSSGVIDAILESQTEYFASVKPVYGRVAISPYVLEVSGFAGGTAAGQPLGMGFGCTSCLLELNPKSDQFESLAYQSTPLYGIEGYYYPKVLGLLLGTLDAVGQDPVFGSIDFDCMVDGRFLGELVSYEVTFPDGSVESFYRVGGVLYDCPVGSYSIRVSVGGESQSGRFSVLAGLQTKVIVRFGSPSGLVVSTVGGVEDPVSSFAAPSSSLFSPTPTLSPTTTPTSTPSPTRTPTPNPQFSLPTIPQFPLPPTPKVVPTPTPSTVPALTDAPASPTPTPALSPSQSPLSKLLLDSTSAYIGFLAPEVFYALFVIRAVTLLGVIMILLRKQMIYFIILWVDYTECWFLEGRNLFLRIRRYLSMILRDRRSVQ